MLMVLTVHLRAVLTLIILVPARPSRANSTHRRGCGFEGAGYRRPPARCITGLKQCLTFLIIMSAIKPNGARQWPRQRFGGREPPKKDSGHSVLGANQSIPSWRL